jgi:Tol biopolymer transport system component
MVGTTLLHYEIHEKLGAGGMGEVYRAKDTKLGRDVALKILPADFAADQERLARFDREARLLASLNHAHIAAIHGIENANGKRFLVLEMVEGEDLLERVRRGPVPIEEALSVARQIADALCVAHENGIIHRDLKPSNIKVTPEGDVKVLDFGLGKALGPEHAASELSQSPTIVSGAATVHGVILGTAAYMSPEQARGRVVDERADIWAFGCILFEMLTGEQLFKGETVSDTLAAVLRAEPDWRMLPAETPPAVRRLLKRCLEKDPKRRLHHMADARIEIEEAIADPRGAAEASVATAAGIAGGAGGRKSPGARVLAIGAVVVALVSLGVGFFMKPAPPADPKVVRRVGIQIWPSARAGGVAISPDGKYIATRGGDVDGRRSLFLRPLDTYEGSVVPASRNCFDPFFSPDGTWVAFFTTGALNRAHVAGGSVQKICDILGTGRGSWGRDGMIYIASPSPDRKSGIYRVRDTGGTPEVVAEPDLDLGERAFDYPDVLPDGRALLFAIETAGSPKVAVLDLKTGEKRVLADEGTHPRYTATGHVVYVSGIDGRLMGAPFDLKKLVLTAPPVPVLEDFMQPGDYDISVEGTLAYFSTRTLFVQNTVAIVDAKGHETTLVDQKDTWAQPRMSPNGKRVLLREVEPECIIWSFDVDRKTLTRLTFEGDCHDPLWSPDGKTITFSFEKGLIRSIYEMPADGTGEKVLLAEASGPQAPGSWTRDGKLLVFDERAASTDWDVWVYSRETGKAEVFLQTQFAEALGKFSNDGRWIAYVSNESGRDEVFVRPYPGPGGKVQISLEGGSSPQWSPVGGRLFYLSGDKMMAVDVTLGSELKVGSPTVFFGGQADFASVDLNLQTFLLDRDNNYDVTPDGKRLIVIKQQGDLSAKDELRVVVNWFEELKRVVPVE